MPFHVLGYEEAIDNTANTDLDAIPDEIITRQNDHFFPSEDMLLLWASAMSANMNRARIVSPTLRQITPPFIRPIIPAAVPASDDEAADYRDYPFRLTRLEELAVEATSDICMGTEQALAFLALSAGQVPTPAGNIFTIRGTSTTTSVALTWTTMTTTWADTLPDGRYAVVGLEAIGATLGAARLTFEEQIWRPGCLGATAVGNQSDDIFRKGRLGIWGTFNNYAFPQVQVLNTAAVSVFTWYMDIMRIS